MGLDLEERYKVCQLIEEMIGADGVIADEERLFLRKIVERFGLPERDSTPPADSDFDERAQRARGPEFGRTTRTLSSLPPDAQTRVMALLVEAAVVDGVVDPNERALLLASAATLGIEAIALEERIAWRLRENTPRG